MAKSAPKPNAVGTITATVTLGNRFEYAFVLNDGVADVVDANWDFGDGVTETAVGTSVVHTYADAGSYGVSAESADLVTTGSISVDIADDSVGTIIVSSDKFDFTFTLAAASDADWDFGDGGSGTGETVTHTYTDAGTYSVTAVGNNGAVTASTSVYVSEPINVDGIYTAPGGVIYTVSDASLATNYPDAPVGAVFKGTKSGHSSH